VLADDPGAVGELQPEAERPAGPPGSGLPGPRSPGPASGSGRNRAVTKISNPAE
jgi:hypothetical protein